MRFQAPALVGELRFGDAAMLGRSAAVLLDIAEYERLVERAELREDLALAEEQIAAGEGIEHEQAKQQVLARLLR